MCLAQNADTKWRLVTGSLVASPSSRNLPVVVCAFFFIARDTSPWSVTEAHHWRDTSVTAAHAWPLAPSGTRSPARGYVTTQPLAELPEGEEAVPYVTTLDKGPPRCRRCRAYINCHAAFVDGGRHWTCNFCGMANAVEADYFCAIDHQV